MNSDIGRDAQKRVEDLAVEAADQFDAPILHNRVSEQVETNDQLRQLVDGVERVYAIEENYDQWQQVRDASFAAAEDLNEYVDAVAEIAVAEACVEVIQNTDPASAAEWHDEEDVEEAINEAREWLADNDTVRDRLHIKIHNDGSVSYSPE